MMIQMIQLKIGLYIHDIYCILVLYACFSRSLMMIQLKIGLFINTESDLFQHLEMDKSF